MSGFREIQPTQAIIPVKKPQNSLERKEEQKQPKKEEKEEQQNNKDDDHKVDEFI